MVATPDSQDVGILKTPQQMARFVLRTTPEAEQ
jgi:hypothetical protein